MAATALLIGLETLVAIFIVRHISTRKYAPCEGKEVTISSVTESSTSPKNQAIWVGEFVNTGVTKWNHVDNA